MVDPGHGSWAERLRAVATLVRVSFRADPARSLVSYVVEPTAGLLGTLAAYWLKLVIDAVTARRPAAAAAAAGALAASFGFSHVVQWLAVWRVRIRLQQQIRFAMEEDLARIVAAIPTLEPFERADFQDRFDLVRGRTGMVSDAISALVQEITDVVRLVGTVALLATVHPALAALPAFGVPSLVTSRVRQRLERRAEEGTAEGLRLMRHIADVSTAAGGPAMEARIFGFRDELIARHRALVERVDGEWRRTFWKQAVWGASGSFAFAAGFAGAVALVAVRAVDGQATAGDVVLAVTLAGRVAGQVGSVVGRLAWLGGAIRVVERYVWIRRYALGVTRPPAEPAAAPARLASGIAFEGVSFRYPGTQTVVLRDVNLRLPAGTTVALVGENGAGKTTLVKLLLRMYDPTEGRITVDGVDLARIPHDDWRARCSAGFQDFARLELLVRETVGVGDVPRIAEDEAVRGALERAGASGTADGLGLDAQLGKTWGGTDLSGGQWQQLALGRAMMRERPLLLVLDEPTASLDAETEHALFERYARAARARSEDGAITVLVSHRFSTVRMADLIVVLDGGRVVEHGSHAELVARGSLYAELYELQARQYR